MKKVIHTPLPWGERIKVRGKIIIISTGQRATFGLTPALSRVAVRHPHRHICDKVEGDGGRGDILFFPPLAGI
jgi:hypothetical protein